MNFLKKGDYSAIFACSLGFLLYLNTLESEFVYDDRRAILTNPDLHPTTPWTNLLKNDFWGTPLASSGSHASYRPLTVATFKLNYLVSTFRPWGYHLVNVLLHCSATYFFIRVARQVLPRNKRKLATLVAGCLFAAHPVHCEAVASVVGRADLLACNFFFLSTLAYTSHVNYRDTCCQSTKSLLKPFGLKYVMLAKTFTICKGFRTKRFKQEDYHRVTLVSHSSGCLMKQLKIWWCMVVFVMLAICATLSKETGVTVFGVGFVYDLVFSRNQGKTLKSSFTILSTTLLLILSLRLQIKTPEFSRADNPSAKDPNLSTRLMTFGYLPALNFFMLVYPKDLSFDWGMDAIPKVQSIRDSRVFFSICFYGWLVLVLGVSVGGVLKRRGVNEVDWRKRGTLQKDNNTTIHCPSRLCLCPKRRKSTIMDSLLFSLSLMIFPFLPASNLFFYVGFVVAERILYIPSAGFCLLIGIAGAEIWMKSEKSRMCFAVGFLVVLVGFCGKTVLRNREWRCEESLFRSGIPFNSAKAYGNLGSVLSTNGRLAEAEQAFRKALEHRPNMADVHYNLAVLLQREQRIDESIRSYQKAIYFRPSLALAYVNLATALIATNRCQEAVAILKKASKLDGTGLKDQREHENAKMSALLQLGAL